MSFRRGLSAMPRHSPGLWGIRCHGTTGLQPSLARCAIPQTSRNWALRRQVMTIAGSDKTGHIDAGPNEGILFFNNLIPMRMRWLVQSEMFMQNLQRKEGADAMFTNAVKRAIPQKLPLQITAIIPRLKEGGAFVRFSHDEHILPSEIEGTLKEHLREDPIKSWWNPFIRIHAGLIRGRPWVEDLKRLPTCRLKVEFVPAEAGVEATELSQEQLYSVFRPYGTLAEITPQPSDSKILPKYAAVDFARTKRAIMAKNCLHGYEILSEDGNKSLAKLKISYESRTKTNWILDWLMNHPRIVIPILAALVATITVAVFDPIRTFFIKAHITRVFNVTDNRFYRWFVSRTKDLLTFRHNRRQDAAMDAIWDERKDGIEQIQKWLLETADTFIVVQGARGSGKRELVIDEALKNRKNTLILDCKPIQEARGDSSAIDAMAVEVGYRPVFSWMNSISGLIDLAAQGATGMKTGFSETLDTQIQKILNNTATALKQIALEGRKKDDVDAYLPDDAYLEAHPELRPVVVVENFLHRSQEGSIIYDKLAQWGAQVTTANIAHVIFMTTDVSFSKSLSKALPDRVFRQLSLGDCSPEAAKRYVLSHLKNDSINQESTENAAGKDGRPSAPPPESWDTSELDSSISLLGGRLTDLEFFARRIKSGQSPLRAVEEIIDQSASEILKMYVLNNPSGDGESRKWTPEQAWQLIRLLSKCKEEEPLRYNEVVQSDLFKASSNGNPDATLSALEQAELITIVSKNGRPMAIKPGKPVFQSAFERLTRDTVLQARMDISTLSMLIAQENAAVDKAEKELELLGSLPTTPGQLRTRIQWLLRKCQASQGKIEKWEADVAAMKKVLNTEY